VEPILKGKSALVTGASKGLGRAIAIRLAEQGAQVAVNYNSSQSEASDVVDSIREMDEEAVSVKADVSKLDEVVSMVRSVEDSFGRNIDILVNNAGIIHDQLLMRMSDDAWHSVIGTNLNGTFYCTRAVLRGMVRNRWGRIINIGSVVGERGNPGQANYTASKAGIIGFTKALSKEVATRNITVNTVNPGYVETDTTAVLTEQQTSHWLSVIPQGKFGEADDIAHMVIFLAQEKAKYITGQVICVDGGMAV
jgi:3-oxoacyl-[acyl-carrier protein] reductase